tara:strand:+ start:460 stop:1311 length:852 start_codon:yes stop_codon:yes gene_type:complete
MKVKHNKKRNVGLLFAQLSQSVSESMVEGDVNKANKALSIVKRHFTPGTELFKEFRLFRAIVATSVPSDSLASSIIGEAKAASKKIDTRLLKQQKSALIKDINYNLKESTFYDRRVADYKIFATVQTLLSEWRNENPDILVMSTFEKELHSHLLKEKELQDLNELKETDVNHLVVDLMRNKIEEKFGGHLNDDQISLLREYVFSEDNKSGFFTKLESVKSSIMKSLNVFESECQNEMIKKQIPKVREAVNSLSTDSADDETISRYLTLMRLDEELTTGDNEDE